MKAVSCNDVWIVKDGNDSIHCWTSEVGLHTKRYSVSSKGRNIENAEQVIKWEDLILKSEGQLKLL